MGWLAADYTFRISAGTATYCNMSLCRLCVEKYCNVSLSARARLVTGYDILQNVVGRGRGGMGGCCDEAE